MQQLEERVAELALLLPDLDAKLDRLQVLCRGSCRRTLAPRPARAHVHCLHRLRTHTRSLPSPQAKLVLALVLDLPATTARILELRGLLPSLNLSALLAQYPWMLVGTWGVLCGRWTQPVWWAASDAPRFPRAPPPAPPWEGSWVCRCRCRCGRQRRLQR